MMDNKSGAGALTRSLLVALLTGVSSLALSDPAEAQSQQNAQSSHDQLVAYNIAPQPLSSALNEFARQSGLRALYSYEQVRGLQAPAVRGNLTREQALAQLLAPSGYSARISDNNTLELANADRPQQGGAEAPAERRAGSADASQSPFQRLASDEENEEIVVTGTNIRGVYPASSPVEIFTADEIAKTGATSTEQFVSRLPQNLNSFNASAPLAAPIAQGNPESVNSVDLRGLGVGTTLILINGRRTTASGINQAIDISAIPIAALDRVEVLTDGASAIYGSDAIGGVVNFILRDDFDGAETRFSYGGAQDSEHRQGAFSQTFGHAWTSGRFLLSYNYSSASALENSDRSYAAAAGPGTLLPFDQRDSVLATAAQTLGPVELSADFLFSQRETKAEYADSFSSSTSRSSSDQYFANLGAEIELGGDTQALLLASYSENDTEAANEQIYFGFGAFSFDNSSFNSSLELSALVNGSAFSLPGGSVRYSLGAGHIQDHFTRPGRRELERASTYAFGEVFAPLVSEEQSIPLVRRLELSLAARYTSYSDESEPPLGVDFGSRTSPKLGILWSPFETFNVRATYGESFRAAPLYQLDPASAYNSLFSPSAQGRPDIWSPTNSTITLNVIGAGNPSLAPETANSTTFGFDYQPSSALRLAFTYFEIEYENRIAIGDPVGLGIIQPSNFPDLYIVDPEADLVEAVLRSSTNFFNGVGIDLTDPAAAATQLTALPSFVIFDNRLRNLATSRMDGMDVSMRYQLERPEADYSLGGSISYIFDYEERITPNSPLLTVVDTALRPVDLRASLFAGATRGPFDTRITLNYVDDYRNPLGLVPGEVDNWTTADLHASYIIGDYETSHTRIGLNILNLFDEDPPFVERDTGAGNALRVPVGFDPVNANPLGRFVTIELTRHW